MDETITRYMQSVDEMRASYDVVAATSSKVSAVAKLLRDWTSAVDPAAFPRERSEAAVAQQIAKQAQEGWPEPAEAESAMLRFRTAKERAVDLWKQIPPERQRHLTAPDKVLFR